MTRNTSFPLKMWTLTRLLFSMLSWVRLAQKHALAFEQWTLVRILFWRSVCRKREWPKSLVEFGGVWGMKAELVLAECYSNFVSWWGLQGVLFQAMDWLINLSWPNELSWWSRSWISDSKVCRFLDETKYMYAVVSSLRKINTYFKRRGKSHYNQYRRSADPTSSVIPHGGGQIDAICKGKVF